ncbi:hypothetical protein DPMN_111462 [Dreissena polymorpha]|uniref:C2H2-type domain-containing protein n=1 Tax=Dreissena polymorpha TaxID=45954 RepID=A0A9D4KEB1_DREPO|nr:hypothetical protein DPMN_111462 [Dreissena polymorpha]
MLKTRDVLLRHTRRHVNSGNYNCCGKAFQDTYNLRRHRGSIGPQSTTMLKARMTQMSRVCVQCGRSLKDKYLLAAHEKSAKKRDW